MKRLPWTLHNTTYPRERGASPCDTLGRGAGSRECDDIARLLLRLPDEVGKEKDVLRPHTSDPKAPGPRGGAGGGFVQRRMWSELHLLKSTLLLCSEGTVGQQVGASGVSEGGGELAWPAGATETLEEGTWASLTVTEGEVIAPVGGLVSGVEGKRVMGDPTAFSHWAAGAAGLLLPWWTSLGG